jgi:RHS repeat-associated protein
VRRARAVAVMLVVALLAGGVVPAPVDAGSSGLGWWQRLSHAITRLAGPAQAQAFTAGAAPQGRVEVPRLRTRYSRTYAVGDGTFEAQVSTGPINFQDASGAWQPIDNTLVASTETGYAWRNKANRYTVSLPANLAGAPIRIQRGSVWLSFRLVGANAAGQVSGNTVTYPDALPGVTLSYAPVGDGIKESIVLANPSVPANYAFDLQTSPGVSFKPDASGGLDVFSGQSLQFSLPAPFVSDASNSPAGFSRAVSFTLAQQPGGFRLGVNIDPAWLASPARQWPVVLDPQVTLVGPGVNADCQIVGGSFANTKFCSQDHLDVGSDPTGNRHGLLYFPIEGALPRDSEVVHSRLALWAPQTLGGGAFTMVAKRLTNGFTLDATWNKRDATNNWTTPGGDYTPTTWDSVPVGGTTGWVYLYPRQLTGLWVNGEQSSLGFLLRRDVEDGTSHLARFTSRNSTDSAHWPNLIITYQARLGKRDAYTHDTKGLSDRAEARVNVANGNLLVGQTDLRVGGIGTDLVVNRTFNGLDPAFASSIGNGWDLSVGADVRMDLYASGTAVLHGQSGEPMPYFPVLGSATTFTSPPGMNNTVLTQSADGLTFTLQFKQSGEVWTFDKIGCCLGRLRSQKDRNGNHLDYVYDASGRLTQIKQFRAGQSVFRTVTASYVGTSTLIDHLTDPAGRTIQYGYTGSQLTSVTDADGRIVRYGYTGDQLTRITDARNNIVNISYQTDGSNRVASVTRVTASPSDTDPTTRYTYNPFVSGTCPPGGLIVATTDVTDANSHTTTYKYDGRDRVCHTTDPLGHSHDSAYDTNDNVTQTTDALTKSTVLGYTTDGSNFSKLTTITRPGSNPTTFTYGSANNPFSPDSKTDSSGNKTTYSYDVAGNLLSAQDTTGGTAGAKASVVRNADGTVKTATDANNHTTSYTYTYSTTNGALTKLVITPPTGSPLGTTTVNFDSLQRTTSITDGKGQTKTIGYDPIDRVKTETVVGTTLQVTHTYDANGNLIQLDDPTGTTTLTYDELNRNLTKALPGRPTITYGYDGVGNLTSLDDAGGTVGYHFDAANRLDQLTEPGGALTTFTSDNADRRKTATFPNGVKVTLGYDDAGRQTSVTAQKGTNPALVDLKYCYKKVTITDTTACGAPAASGNTDTRWKLTDSRLGTTTNYAYDTQGRLGEAKTVVGGTQDFQYTYDAAGNRTKQVVNGGTPTFYGYGVSNQLCWSKATTIDPGSTCTTPSSATTYTTDANGNLTTSSAGFSASYNGFDQTTAITAPGGSTLSPMTYGGSTQVERRQAGSTAFTTNALGVGAADPGAGKATFYTRDPGGSLISQRTSKGTQYYVLDGLGSVVALTDSTGAAVGRYSYEPYGKATFSGTVTSNFQFASGYTDPETGLVKFGARYYDPSLGRWTQRDAFAGHLASPKTINRYAYAGCNPTNHVDPSGLQYMDIPIEACRGFWVFIGLTVGLYGTLISAAGLAAYTFGAVGSIEGIFIDPCTNSPEDPDWGEFAAATGP